MPPIMPFSMTMSTAVRPSYTLTPSGHRNSGLGHSETLPSPVTFAVMVLAFPIPKSPVSTVTVNSKLRAAAPVNGRGIPSSGWGSTTTVVSLL